jgi:DNA invertase Pin-like site-specific DNA recombinase
MSEASLLRSIRGAASRRQTAERERRQATEDLHGFIRQAKAANVPITKIASEAGLSRQAVYDVLEARPSS